VERYCRRAVTVWRVHITGEIAYRIDLLLSRS